MNNVELVQSINKDLAIALPDEIAFDKLQTELATYINSLIENNFQKLVILLYRIDVSELKLRQLLQQHPEEEAGKIIASLIIERQLQKIKTRAQFSQRDSDFTEEEKW
jgi:hypothetical protein